MFALIDKASDYLSPIFLGSIVAALLGGIFVRGVQPGDSGEIVAAPLRWAAVLAVAVLLLVLAERLVPLRGISQEKWVWHYRPRARLPRTDSVTAIHLGISAVVGAFLGAAAGHSLWAAGAMAVAAVVARGMVGYVRARGDDLPTLLRAGRTRKLMENLSGLQDTEVVADLLAIHWLRGRSRWGSGAGSRAGWRRGAARGGSRGGSATPLGLAWRRLWRRSYLLLGALAVLIWHCALAPAYGAGGAFITVAAWGFLCAGVYRAADFRRMGVDSASRWVFLLCAVGLGSAGLLGTAALLGSVGLLGLDGVLGSAGLGVSVASWKVLAVPLVWFWIGWRRGEPARVDTFSFFDTGMGVSFSPEILGYYLRGLWPLIPLALILN
ncbi:hypothetical protein [Corynebacterium lowii]|uniref:Uncharacterized protein n=1 Tax=Corynebacterium lowii TaxID=1544413 RepID=A0A0Q0UM27_9CORY|nr:hypothetical protein [Corynebacterium lowii]KQB87473.1 hypothetical protein Clow_00532 [Corynebacterium lowii]MDP9851933.1 hypothetical protein [Corynebacterium lowii]